jgi:UDP-2,3-diacylglucosamine pyrophosphatase LpxH
LFLSDLHLGAIGSRADLVMKFLKRNVADTYMLVGDILDIGHPFLPHWTPNQQAVIDHLRARQAEGARLVYVRGNHDPEPDHAPEGKRLPVAAVTEAEHVGPDGRRYLVVHGDGQDVQTFQNLFLRRFASQMDQGLRRLDHLISRYVYDRGPERRSVIEFVLSCVNWGMYPNRSYEERLVALARAGGYDGVICGHFHMAELHDRHGLVYANCGDWMDSFTALAADHHGRLHLLGGRNAFAGVMRPIQPPEMVFS